MKNMQLVHMRIPKTLLVRLDKLAELDGETRSTMIRNAMVAFVFREEKKL